MVPLKGDLPKQTRALIPRLEPACGVAVLRCWPFSLLQCQILPLPLHMLDLAGPTIAKHSKTPVWQTDQKREYKKKAQVHKFGPRGLKRTSPYLGSFTVLDWSRDCVLLCPEQTNSSIALSSAPWS